MPFRLVLVSSSPRDCQIFSALRLSQYAVIGRISDSLFRAYPKKGDKMMLCMFRVTSHINTCCKSDILILQVVVAVLRYLIESLESGTSSVDNISRNL